MLTSFVLSMALAAPVPPAPATPVASGPAPRIVELKANADGKVMVAVTRTEKVTVAVGNAANPAGAAPAALTREIKKSENVELGDVKDLTVTTADGKKVDVADALKKVKGGAVVVVSADGKPVSPIFLKAFKDDVLVLVAPELVGPAITTPARPLPGIRPLPAQPGQIQIQIAPGVVPPPAPPK